MNLMDALFCLLTLILLQSNICFSQDNSDALDRGKDVPDIINRHIGKSETHTVVTEDGYILTLFRIPQKNPKGVVLLQHPVTMDSKVWLLQGNESTAFLFWRAGYDVWLSNDRGTFYSKKHMKLEPSDPQFWNYSFHEIGFYDLAAAIQYIKRTTKIPKIIYVGHSMGTTTSFVYASLRPEEAFKSVKLFVSITPSCYFKYSRTMQRLIPLIPTAKSIVGPYSVMAHNSSYLQGFRELPRTPFLENLIMDSLTLSSGGKSENIDTDILETGRHQCGSEASWKIFEHYGQLITGDGEFRMFDYGQKTNLQLYNAVNPPLYPLEDIKVPFYLVYGSDDIINNPKDVELLYRRLPQGMKMYGRLKVKDYGHLSFHLDRDRIPRVYNKILKLLDRI